MECRHERRTLSARRDIGSTQIVDDGNAGFACERGTIAKLDRQLLARPVQHRLTVIADDIDAAAVDAVHGQERIHRARVQHGGDLLGLRDHTRPLGAHAQNGRLVHGAAQDRNLVLLIEMERARPEARDLLAIRFDRRNVDAVHRRAAHQPDRPHAALIL